MTRRALAASAAVTALALALTGCVAKSDLAQSIPVAITDDGCAVAAATAPAGAVTFSLENTGSDVNEFEILAEDQLRIVGEKENVTPGQEVEFTAHLTPGTYYTACKFQQVGAPVGLAEFTVTGEVLGDGLVGERPVVGRDGGCLARDGELGEPDRRPDLLELARGVVGAGLELRDELHGLARRHVLLLAHDADP